MDNIHRIISIPSDIKLWLSIFAEKPNKESSFSATLYDYLHQRLKEVT